MPVRIAGKGDLRRIDAIEQSAFPPGNRLEAGESAIAIQQPLFTCVATRRQRVIGFAQIHATKKVLQIVNIAVDPQYQRSGVGSEIIRWLRSKSSCPEFLTYTPETYLSAQLFFRKNGFTCINTVVDLDNETYYEFSWLRPEKKK